MDHSVHLEDCYRDPDTEHLHYVNHMYIDEDGVTQIELFEYDQIDDLIRSVLVTHSDIVDRLEDGTLVRL